MPTRRACSTASLDPDHTVPALDGVRAIGVLLVLTGHASILSRPVAGPILGVTIFFFLSGFLMVRILRGEFGRTGRINLVQFYRRRAARLIPALLFTTVVVSLTAYFFGARISAVELAACLFYFMNYFVAFAHEAFLPFGPTWSLAVEAHFYLLLPLMMLLSRFRPSKMAVSMIVICFLCLAWRSWVIWHRPSWIPVPEDYTYMATECRIDSMIFGGLLALIETSPELLSRLANKWSFFLGLIVITVVTLGIRNPFFAHTIRYSAQGLAMIPLMAALIYAPDLSLARDILSLRALRWIGLTSYSIYLWQWPIIFSLLFYFGVHGLVWSLVASGFTIAISSLSYRWIERPGKKAVMSSRLFTLFHLRTKTA